MSISKLEASGPDLRQDPYYEQRVQLACAFRWTARLDMHEAVANHFSLSVNDGGTRFLINPDGRHFSTIRAGDLLLADARNDRTMEREDAPDPTAWGLHGALHRRCPEARCALHVHSRYATVLACLEDCTMPPIDQNCARFFNRVAVDTEYGGMALEDEAERCVRLLADKRIMLMGNHGVMITAPSVAQAFDEMFYFERAARTLVTAYMTGRSLRVLPDDVAEKTARQWEEFAGYHKHFRELQKILDEEEPDYRL
ncbi:MAG: class II aldolase and adducin N-terminal domain-containing protein [Arenicellales bacterium]